MNKKDLLTKILAIAGTVLVWLPILAPVLFSLTRLTRGAPFLIDYLMPAEFFLVALAGGGLLLWAARRAHSQLKLIIGCIAVAAVSLVGSMGLAMVTGLASGEIEPVGLPWMATLALLMLYTLALVVLGVAGILLLRDLYRSGQPIAAGRGAV